MPAVICENNHVTHWRNQTGSRQPDTCPQCGTPAMRAAYDGDKLCYVPVPQRKSVSRSLVNCAICGKRRAAPSANVRSYQHPVVIEGEWIQEDGKWVRSEHRIEPGQYVCWFHELVTPQA